MTIVGTAEINILAKGDKFAASLKEESQGALGGLASDAEIAAADAGSKLDAGLSDAAALAGTHSGTKVHEGLEAGLHDAEGDAEAGGKNIGEKIASGLSGSMGSISGTLTGGLSKVLDKVGEFTGVNFEKATGHLESFGESAKDSEGKTRTLGQSLDSLGKGTLLVGGAAFGALGLASLKMGEDFQASTAQMQASTGETSKQAQAMGQAFLGTAGTTKFSASQMEEAFSGVGAQLAASAGHTLSTKEAMDVMNASMDSAEATGQSLTSTTKDLANVMQAYGLKASDADQANNILFQSGKMTGVGMDGVSNAFMKLHSNLGVLTPPLGEMGGLLVDLTNHGETGRAAMSVLGTAMQTLLKPSNDLNVAQQKQQVALQGLPPQLQALGEKYISGSMSAKELSAATKNMTQGQKEAWNQLTTATTAVATAKTNLDAMGISTTNAKGQFVGMQSVIAQVHDKIQGMSQAQKMATLQQIFGAAASQKLLTTIEAGPEAYKKAAEAVSKEGSAHEAAAAQAKTLKDQMETIEATGKDLVTSLGTKLLPIVLDVAHVFLGFTEDLFRHKAILLAVAGVIGGVLATAVTVFAVNKIKGMIDSTKNAMNTLKDLGSGVKSLATKLIEAVPKLAAFGAAQDEAAVSSEALAAGEAEADAAGMPLIATIGLVVGAIAVLALGIYELVTHWKTVWKDIKRVLDDAWHFIDEAFHKIVNAIKKYGPMIIKVLLAPFTGGMSLILPEIIKHWSQIENFFKSIGSKILSALGAIGSTLLKVGGDLIGGLWTGIQDGWKVVTSFFTSMASTVMGWISDAATWLVKLGGDIISGEWQGIQTIWKTVTSFFTSMASTVTGWISDAATWLVKLGGDVISGLWSGIQTVWKTVTGFFNSMASTVEGWISDAASWLLKIGGDVISGLWSGIQTGWTTVSGFFTGMASTVEGWVSDAASWLLGTGKDVITGLWNGISGMGSWLWGKVSSFASHFVKDAIHSALNILSPSRVTFASGQMVAQGLGLGILDQAQMVENSARELAMRAQKGIAGLDLTASVGTAGALAGGSSVPGGNTITVANGAFQINVGGSVGDDNVEKMVAEIQNGFRALTTELKAGSVPLRVAR